MFTAKKNQWIVTSDRQSYQVCEHIRTYVVRLTKKFSSVWYSEPSSQLSGDLSFRQSTATLSQRNKFETLSRSTFFQFL